MKYIKNFFEQFIILIQFMTRIPIPLKISYSEKKLGKSIKFFPLVGLIIGLILYFANFLIIVYLKNIFYNFRNPDCRNNPYWWACWYFWWTIQLRKKRKNARNYERLKNRNKWSGCFNFIFYHKNCPNLWNNHNKPQISHNLSDYCQTFNPSKCWTF